MPFGPADELAVRRVRFSYTRGAGDVSEEARERRRIERANAMVPALADQVCAALRGAVSMFEEVRDLYPMLSHRSAGSQPTSVRLDTLVFTDRQVHVVLAGTDTGVEVRTFAYGELDAETKLVRLRPELTEKRGRPVLVMPRVTGNEAKWDTLLAAPPAARNPALPTAADVAAALPPQGGTPTRPGATSCAGGTAAGGRPTPPMPAWPSSTRWRGRRGTPGRGRYVLAPYVPPTHPRPRRRRRAGPRRLRRRRRRPGRRPRR